MCSENYLIFQFQPVLCIVHCDRQKKLKFVFGKSVVNLDNDQKYLHQHYRVSVMPLTIQELISSITIGQLNDLITKLCLHEKISIIFLLADTNNISLAFDESLLEIKKINENQISNFFVEWVKSCKNWQSKLVEALCIGQVNHILVNHLRFNKDELNMHFDRKNPAYTAHVHRYFKILYLMLEELTIDETQTIINYISTNLHGKQNVAKDVEFLEIHLLNWILNGIISLGPIRDDDDQSKLVDVCVLLDVIQKMQKLEKLQPILQPILKELSSKSGYILIINQMIFSNSTDLPNRESSIKDEILLTREFSARGFIVQAHHDVKSDKILTLVGKVANDSVGKESVIVVILSHGMNNHVYGSDSIPVSIDNIKEALVIHDLKDTPKLLLIQACQNGEPSMDNENSVTSPVESTDAVNNYNGLIVIMATIQGRVAYSDKKHGSVFIYALDQAIRKSNDTGSIWDIYIEMCSIVQKSLKKNREQMCPSMTINGTINNFILPRRIHHN